MYGWVRHVDDDHGPGDGDGDASEAEEQALASVCKRALDHVERAVGTWAGV